MGRVKTVIHPNGSDIGQDITDHAENGVKINDIIGEKKSFEVTTAADLYKRLYQPFMTRTKDFKIYISMYSIMRHSMMCGRKSVIQLRR